VRTFAEILAQMYEVVSTMNADWDRRTDATIDLVSQAGHAAVDEFRDEIQDLVADLRESVDGTTSAVGGSVEIVTSATQRLVTAGQALLGYLARRDQLLEAERDRVLHELLDEFARGLPAKDRRAMGERVTDALERRKDARDAERYRRTTAGAPAVEVPEVPEELERLAEPAPVPKTARKRPAKKAPGAKKAAPQPAKKSTPSKATGAKPPTRTPAKKAAKRTAKRSAPAPVGAPAVADQPPAPPESDQANTTQPLDGEGTTRV